MESTLRITHTHIELPDDVQDDEYAVVIERGDVTLAIFKTVAEEDAVHFARGVQWAVESGLHDVVIDLGEYEEVEE